MYSAFHPSSVGTVSRGNSLFGGTSLRPSPRVFKELGPTRGLPPANWGVHTYMPCMQVAGLALQSVYQGQLSLPSLYMNRRGTLGLPGELSGLTKGLKLGGYRRRPGGYYSGTLVMVVTAVLKAVSLLGGTYSDYRAPSVIV